MNGFFVIIFVWYDYYAVGKFVGVIAVKGNVVWMVEK